jgi:hypothetical protein
VTSIDAAIAERGLPVPQFVKVDVEGFERQVLEGMAGTLRSAAPGLMVELHGAGEERKRDNARAVVAGLLELGYALTHVESGGAVPGAESAPLNGHLHATR